MGMLGVGLTMVFASHAMADEYCASFVESGDFEAAYAFTDEGQLGRLEDLFTDRFVGHSCTNEELTVIMEALGFSKTSERDNTNIDPRKASGGVMFNREIAFCYPPTFPWGIFMSCGGVAGFLFLDNKIVRFVSHGQV